MASTFRDVRPRLATTPPLFTSERLEDRVLHASFLSSTRLPATSRVKPNEIFPTLSNLAGYTFPTRRFFNYEPLSSRWTIKTHSATTFSLFSSRLPFFLFLDENKFVRLLIVFGKRFNFEKLQALSKGLVTFYLSNFDSTTPFFSFSFPLSNPSLALL